MVMMMVVSHDGGRERVRGDEVVEGEEESSVTHGETVGKERQTGGVAVEESEAKVVGGEIGVEEGEKTMVAMESERAEGSEEEVVVIGGHGERTEVMTTSETSEVAGSDGGRGEPREMAETLGEKGNLRGKQVVEEEVRVSGDLGEKKVMGPTPEIKPEKRTKPRR